MARQEQDREDLMREATALVERVKLQLLHSEEPTVIGFRRDGSPSFFFDSERVLQFNSRGELRRGYWDGQLLKADRRQLVLITRTRDEQGVKLCSRQFTADETQQFLTMAAEHLLDLQTALVQGRFAVLRQVPPDREILGRILQWLEKHGRDLAIAPRPHVL